MTETLFTQQVQARDLKPGMHISTNEHAGVAKKLHAVTDMGTCIIVNYTEDMGGRTFRPDEFVEVV